MRHLWFLALLPGLVFAGGPSQKTLDYIQLLEKKTPGFLDEFNTPGIAVALIENGEIVYEKGFGFQDAAKTKPVDVETGFNIGSVSKTIAAWAVMTLVEEGRVELDAPISRYVERWKLPASEFKADGVTIARLLSHTAGLSLHGYPGFPPDVELPTLEASLSGAINAPSPGVKIIMEPGTQWKYSGGGYSLLQMMIEEVTGQSFADYARERVLKPLGMKTADYHLSKAMLARASEAHDMFGDRVDYDRFTAQAAAGLQTSIHDLALFAAAALKGPKGEAPGRGVLKPDTLATMMEPALDGKAPSGLGYFIPRTNIKIAGHGGDNTGWHANMNVALDQGLGMVILTNADGGAVLRDLFTCYWFDAIGVVPNRPCKAYSFGLIINRLKEHGSKDFKSWYENAEKTMADRYIFHEMINNQVGYNLVQKGLKQEGLALLKLNTEKYPDSFNTWDSLGWAYMQLDQIEPAIENYRKSIEMNPKNEEGKQYLAELLEKQAARKK